MIDRRKKPVLWLHIGAPKTATTALQLVMENAGPRLLEGGWLYPLTGRLGPGHHHFARAISLSRRGTGDSGSIFTLLRKEVEAVQPENVLLSSEDFFLYCDLTQLQKELEWADVRVLAYVRQEQSWINSYFAQYIKDPYFRFFDRRSDPYNTLEDLACFADVNRLRAFAKVFGQDALSVRSYDDPNVRKDLVTDACSVIGLPQSLLEAPGSPSLDSRANVSIQAEELELVRQSNLLFTNEECRDRWLYELQQISQQRISRDNAKENSFDLGMSTTENALVLDRMSHSSQIILAEYGNKWLAPTNSQKTASSDHVLSDTETKLRLDVSQTPTLNQDQLVTIGAGLAARSAIFTQQIDDLVGFLDSLAEQRAKRQHSRLRRLMAWVKGKVDHLSAPMTIAENDAIILVGKAADVECPAARLGMLALFEIGLCEEARLFVMLNNDWRKPSFVQIKERNDFLLLAAELTDKATSSELDHFDKIHIIADPVLPLGPLSVEAPSPGALARFKINSGKHAKLFVVDKPKTIGFRAALRAGVVKAPRYRLGNFLDICATIYANRWLKRSLPTIKRLPVKSQLPPGVGASAGAYCEAVTDALKLDPFYRDYLSNRTALQSEAIKLYSGKKSLTQRYADKPTKTYCS